MLKWSATDIEYVQTPIKCSVDAKCSCIYNGKKIKFNIEIKNYTHTHTSKTGTKNCIHIKLNKLNGMFNESKDVDGIFLVAIYNHNTYWFNCKSIDWKNVDGEYKWQKVTQFNPNSEWAYFYTYSLPLDMAFKTISCEQFEEEWKTGRIYGNN